jgi:hypothetical protein
MLIVVLAVSTEGGEVTLEPPIELVPTGNTKGKIELNVFSHSRRPQPAFFGDVPAPGDG